MHTREIALRGYGAGAAMRASAVNVDLIAGLPGQTMASLDGSRWRRCVGAGVEHASVYMLEVDEDSRLGRELLGGGGALSRRERCRPMRLVARFL